MNNSFKSSFARQISLNVIYYTFANPIWHQLQLKPSALPNTAASFCNETREIKTQPSGKVVNCVWNPAVCKSPAGLSLSLLSEASHAGTYPAHHVHVGGGHVGWLLRCRTVDCSPTCSRSRLLCTWATGGRFVCGSAESAQPQSLFERVNNERANVCVWGLLLPSSVVAQNNTPVFIFTL